MIHRFITQKIHEALKHRPVVYIQGGRQTGKSTLAKSLTGRNYKAEYVSLDDLTYLALANNDPKGWLANYPGNLIIDEVQMSPDLLTAIKNLVDQERRPGRYILTGSSNLFTLPKVSESLAGRMDIFRLYPLAQIEIEEGRHHLIDELFTGKFKRLFEIRGVSRQDIYTRIIKGGYPEVVLNKDVAANSRWFNSYITTLLQRDVRDIASIDNLEIFPQLLGILAARVCGLINYADISRNIGVPQTSLKRYIGILGTAFIVEMVQPWSGNLEARYVKSPKIFFNDSGLLAHLSGVSEKSLNSDTQIIGKALENFIFTELAKLQSWSDNFFRIYHYRTHLNEEIDFILERNDGTIIAIEVKAAESLRGDPAAQIKEFAAKFPKKFGAGIVFYTGKTVIPLGEKIFAVPVSGLWQ